MTQLLIALAAGAGLALAAAGFLLRSHERIDELKEILEMPGGEREVPVEEVTETRAAFYEPGVTALNHALERLNLSQSMRSELERARLPIRPGEFLLAGAGLGVAAMLLAWFFTQRIELGLPALALVPWLAWRVGVRAKIERRRKRIEEQLPESLSLIAGSLEAGHTFLRAIEMLIEESEPPISEEFERVLAETRLGDSLVDALERMAARVQVGDLVWAVQAIRIQQTVGGKLAELLGTLAEFMRARQEIRREVQVLTAEGRLSAYVLGGLPVAMVLLLQGMSPGYLAPMFQGWGLAALVGAMVSVVIGIVTILKMARIDV